MQMSENQEEGRVGMSKVDLGGLVSVKVDENQKAGLGRYVRSRDLVISMKLDGKQKRARYVRSRLRGAGCCESGRKAERRVGLLEVDQV